ncbi:MAG: cofactor assembly of complex C subunit B [Cyanophyceae cyanobacterium]
MNTSVLSSTFLLTLLLMVGLFFFIRASTKDRTQQLELVAQAPGTQLMNQMREYFERRAYRTTAVDETKQVVTLEGFVRPSLFLALFLTALAGIGFLCLALVLAILSPPLKFSFALILLAPGAGIFYWRRAGRVEQVQFEVQPLATEKSLLTVTAHRDELNQLRQAYPQLTASSNQQLS